MTRRLHGSGLARAAVLTGVALLLVACTPARVGVVDTERILSESVRALQYQRQLDEREKAMAADLRLLIGRLPPADLEARRNQYLKELQQLKADLEAQLNQEIRDAVAVIAKERRLRSGVLVKNPMLFSLPANSVDITDEVITRLK